MEFGKTTIAKYIEEKYGFLYLKDPLKEIFEISNEHLMKISNKIFNFADDRIKAWYLALGDMYVLSQYKDKNVVLDRHILLNYFWNGNKNTEEIFKLLRNYFGKPDLVILLYADIDVRMERIRKRNPNDADLKNEQMKQFGYDKIIDFLERYQYQYEKVDTNCLTIKEVKECCSNIIENLL